MGLDTRIIRKTDPIEDHLSSPEDGHDTTHHDVGQLNYECRKGASATRIEVIDAVSDPKTRYVLYAGYAYAPCLFYESTKITQVSNGDDCLVQTCLDPRIYDES
jgi:hypothetical protein